MKIAVEKRSELTADFRGNLRQVPVPMVLHRIVGARGKGTLTLSKPGETIHLFFVDGELKTAATTRRGMRIGEMLLLHGDVEEEQIEEALRAIGSGRHGRLGKLLVEKGFVSRGLLDEEIRKHFEEIFFSCFLWREGEFAFFPSRGRLDSDVALDLPTAALIIEGVRRVPEEDRFLEALGDPASFGRATDLAPRVETLRLNSEEAYLLSLCDGKTRLRDILRIGGPREQTGRTLYTLLACGLIEFVPASPAEAPAVPYDDSPLVFPVTPDLEPEADAKVCTDQARAGYLEALACLEKRDYYGAILLLQETVRLVPENSEYRYRLAGALSHNKPWRHRALDEYREAFRLDPMRQALMIDYAELLLLCREDAEARTIARQLIDRYPGDASSHELLDRCEGAIRDHSDGQEQLKPSEVSDPAELDVPGASIFSRMFRHKPR